MHRRGGLATPFLFRLSEQGSGKNQEKIQKSGNEPVRERIPRGKKKVAIQATNARGRANCPLSLSSKLKQSRGARNVMSAHVKRGEEANRRKRKS